MAFHPRRRRVAQADWSRIVGSFALATLIIAIAAHRTSVIDTNALLVTLMVTVALAVVSLICGVWALVHIWSEGDIGAHSATAGFLWSILVLAVPIIAAIMIGTHPRLNDVTTDTNDPPRFTVPEPGREFAAVVAPETAEALRLAYPELLPRRYELPIETVYDAVQKMAIRSRWRVLAQTVLNANDADLALLEPEFQIGEIEAAVASTFIGFRGRVAVRVREDGDETVVDLRSTTFGLTHGLGIDYRRIASFYMLLETALEQPENFAQPQDRL